MTHAFFKLCNYYLDLPSGIHCTIVLMPIAYIRHELQNSLCHQELLAIFDVHGTMHRYCVLSSTTNKMQRYTIFFMAVNAVHVSGGFSGHHQELKIQNCTHNIWYVLSLLAANR
jgi:hypothetical protein